MTSNFVIQLSQEELLYLLRRQGLPDLPGMGEHPWGEISEDEAQRILETAGRGLAARGVISITENGIQIDNSLHAILTACAYPEQMVILNSQINGQLSQVNFFRVKEFDILHTLPYPWIHRFEAFSALESDMGFGQVTEWLSHTAGDQISPTFRIEPQKLQEIYTLVSSDIGLAKTELLSCGMSDKFSELFLGVLKNATIKILVQAVAQLRPDLRQNVFTILADAQSIWLVNTEQQDDHEVALVTNVDHSHLDAMLSSAYQLFQKSKE